MLQLSRLAILPVQFLVRLIRRHRWISLFLFIAIGSSVYLFGIPALADWRFTQAKEHLAHDNLKEAAVQIEKAVSLAPRNSDYLRLAARIERLSGRMMEAKRYLERCVQVEKAGGGAAETQLEWLLLRAEMGDVDDLAVGLHALVREKHPESEHILETIARAYMRDARYPLAERELQFWLLIYPNSSKAFELRGWVRQQIGVYGPALADYREAVELDPKSFRARLLLVQMLFTSLKLDEVEPHLQILLQAEPNNRTVLYYLATSMRDQGKPAEEIYPIVVRVVEADPNEANGLMLIGKVEFDLKKFNDAETHLRRVIELDPSFGEAYFMLARCLQDQPGREAEQRECLARVDQIAVKNTRLRELLKSVPRDGGEDVVRMVELGTLLIWSKQESQGMFWLYKVLDKQPDNVAANDALAAYYEAHGHEDKAKYHRRMKARSEQKP
jgi:tetratricopeptide (TPR) repeat protein